MDLAHPFRLAAAVAGLVAAAVTQGPVALLADVEPSAPNNPGSFYEPKHLEGVSWNGFLYFAADGDGYGKELWRSNGAAQNATLVVDLVPAGGSDPEPLGVLGGWLVFVADDGIRGRELWRTDGTAGGTQVLADITPGSFGTFGSDVAFARMNNQIYFLAAGRLWKTDGTPGNTIAVSATVFGADSIVAGTSHLWMPVDTGGGGELWASDGASSVYLAATLPSAPQSLVALPGIQAVFACDDGINGEELWRSLGSPGTTQMLVDLQPSSGSSNPRFGVSLNGAAVFVATENSQTRLWRSDGTVGGTFALDPANGPRNPQDLRAAGNRVWCSARRNGGVNVGWEPWATDGTVAGTQLVFDVWPGSATSGAGDFAWDGSQWTYFSAHDGSAGYELWRSDLVTTQRVSDIVPGFGDGAPTILGFANGYCMCAAQFEGGAELWASQGNATQLVRDIRRGSNGDSDPRRFTPRVDGQFWFTARRGLTTGLAGPGREPHFSSGLPGSAQMLVDSVAGYQSGADLHTRAAGFGTYTWFNTVPGSVLWRTAGTVPSTNSIPGFQVTFTDMVTFQGRVFVDATTPATGEELFAFNDPLQAPVLVKDVVPGTGGSSLANLTVVGNRLFFTATESGSNNLWISDGTTAGTQRVWLNTVGGNLINLRAVGRRLFFDNGSNVLLVSDGTGPGTTVIGTTGQTHEKVAVGNRLFFVGEPTGAGTGHELCASDGATITVVKDVRPGSASSQPYALAAFGNGVLFIAHDGVSGFELWKSDGTTAGTQLVVDLVPGLGSGCPPYDGGGVNYTGFVFAERGAQRALFAATNGIGGIELWRTDGTAAGTVLHADIQPGGLGSFPAKPVRAGTQLVFAATQTELPAPPTGRELFALPTMAIASPVGTACSNTLAEAPLAATIGVPFLGNAAFGLTVDGAPSSVAVVAIGEPVEQTVGPCEIRVANFVTAVVVTDAAGQAVQSLPLPPTPSLASARFGVQWGVAQTNGPFLGLLALSNGVDFVLQTQ
jgi:ELWxxDGT repeat protein